MQAVEAIVYAVLYAAIAVPILLVGGIILYGGYRAYMSFTRGYPLASAGWAIVALSPFLVYVIGSSLGDFNARQRDKALAALPRVAAPADYPRTLEVHGYLLPETIAALMIRGDFDDVVQFQSRPSRANERVQGEVFERRSGEDCESAADAWVSHVAQGTQTRHQDKKTLSNCISKTTDYYWNGTTGRDAVVFLMGHATTHKPGNSLSGDHYEARLRRNGENALLDYYESSKVSKPASPQNVSKVSFILKAIGRLPPRPERAEAGRRR